MSEKLDAALEVIKRREGESVEVRRQLDPGRSEPSFHVKQVEKARDDYSSWSGASMGGGVWSGYGRNRH